MEHLSHLRGDILSSAWCMTIERVLTNKYRDPFFSTQMGNLSYYNYMVVEMVLEYLKHDTCVCESVSSNDISKGKIGK